MKHLSSGPQIAIREGKRVHIFARQPARHLILGKDDALAFIGERKLSPDETFVLEREHISQSIGFDVHGPMQVVSAARDLCKLDVIAVRKTGQERVGSVHVRDARKSEFLDQTVLQRAIGSLDAALRLRAVCTKNLDV